MGNLVHPIRVLYSFPHKLGGPRIENTAWQQVNGVAAAGAQVLAFPAACMKPVRADVKVLCTLARGRLRIPYKVLGHARTFALHDYLVSKRLERLAEDIDIVHVWPQGGLRTLATAARLGIPTVLERPNTHTRHAYEVVRKECGRLGVALPPGFEHAYNEDILQIEEEEFRRAFRLLCPSDFVIKTFLDRGFKRDKLAHHLYGFDEQRYFPGARARNNQQGLVVLFAGSCAVRKGLHFALEAWLKSPAHIKGRFSIAGRFLPAYREKLAAMLAHPSVKVLGERNDVPDLMRESDVLMLPSLEEGSALVCSEALGSGCVPLVSEACTDLCVHRENALVHEVGDISTLSAHITLIDNDRALLQRLREAGIELAPRITWTAAGVKLREVYRETISAFHSSPCRARAVGS